MPESKLRDGVERGVRNKVRASVSTIFNEFRFSVPGCAADANFILGCFRARGERRCNGEIYDAFAVGAEGAGIVADCVAAPDDFI